MNDFAATFNQLRATCGKSLNQVASLSGLDRSYLLRLSTGEKDAPSSVTIMRIYLACVTDLRIVERDPTVVYSLEEMYLAAAATSARKQMADESLTSVK